MSEVKIQHIINAVKRAKASEFGVTAVKVELEAHLHRSDSSDWEDEDACHDAIMEKLATLGLTRRRDERERLSHGVGTDWCPVAPLTYGEFYDDGSVDSEFTFTILLDDPENVLLLPKVLEAWNEFCSEVSHDTGWDVDVDGAGMHMAFLNEPHGRYPSQYTASHLQRFNNFQRSMTLLLPALYFLGSSDGTSRPLEYRYPRVTIYGGEDDWDDRRHAKFSAITYNQGALEFRVFDTCYQNPDVVLDNVVVMSNAIRRYWKRTYVPSGLEKVCRRTAFGNDNGGELSRFYVTVEHVDLLNGGLERLKPAYYTVRELKGRRDFRVNKRSIVNAVSRIRWEAVQQYKEYEARFKWQLRTKKYSYIEQAITELTNGKDLSTLNEAEVIAEAEKQAEAKLQRDATTKQPLDSFVAEQIERAQHRQAANFTLEVA